MREKKKKWRFLFGIEVNPLRIASQFKHIVVCWQKRFPSKKGRINATHLYLICWINIGVNVLLVLIFYTFFYFGLYIFILPLLIPKLIKT